MGHALMAGHALDDNGSAVFDEQRSANLLGLGRLTGELRGLGCRAFHGFGHMQIRVIGGGEDMQTLGGGVAIEAHNDRLGTAELGDRFEDAVGDLSTQEVMPP